MLPLAVCPWAILAPLAKDPPSWLVEVKESELVVVVVSSVVVDWSDVAVVTAR